MLYIDRLKNNDSLEKYPFEHTYRNVAHQSFLSRLASERNQYDAGLLPSDGSVFVKLIVFVERVWDEEEAKKLYATISLWTLQSCPNTKGYIVPTESNFQKVEKWFNSDHGTETVTTNFSLCCLDSLSLDDTGYFIFSRPGDIHHPSLVYRISTSLHSGSPDIFNWNFQVLSAQSEEVVGFHRLPRIERYTLWHQNYFVCAAAFKSGIVRNSTSFLQKMMNTDAHLLYLELLENSELTWQTLPEYFQLVSETRLTKPALHQSLAEYQSFVRESVPDFDLNIVNVVTGEYYLTPKRKPKVMSVIIPFRDKPNLTVRCVESLFNQNVSGQLEIILVNNQSTTESIVDIETAISARCEKMTNILSAKIIEYNKPFNHSQQCNLGISQSTGDVIVLLNNDATLLSQHALEELGAWAIHPGIGTVGCRIEDSNEQLVCAGIKTRINSGYDYNSCVEESRDPTYARIVRETFANTFAFSAIARSVIDKVGPLNSLEFPNGYNDVEYNLRVRQVGLKNIFLGHLAVAHQPGTSRGKCDEITEKILIRERFPEIFSDSLFQLENDAHLVARVNKFAQIRKSTTVRNFVSQLQVIETKSATQEKPVGIEEESVTAAPSKKELEFPLKLKNIFRKLMARTF